jgi:hypothetical protein
MKRFRPAALTGAFLLAVSFAAAQSENPTPIAKIDVGAEYVGWGTNNTGSQGSEILVPLTLSAIPWGGAKVYAQTEFANGNYIDSVSGPETLNLSNLSDTVLGFETSFKSFNVPSLLNVGLNIPTGDPTWETKQTNSIVPTYFIDSDYRGRGWGLSCLYGISMPAGSEQYGLAVGYFYSGAFNPYYGTEESQQLKLGDSAFLSLNHITDRGNGQTDVIRLSAFYFMDAQINGSNLMQMGPNLNASYGWQNPKALSFEAGAQYFFPAEQSGQSENLLGTRLYATPSYCFGDFTVTGQFKYVLSNGFSQSDPLYVGGGWLVGLEPSYRFRLDKSSSLRVSASYDYIDAINGGLLDGNLIDVDYGHWTFSTHYEVNL